jgi:hypothetical protein
VGVTVREGDRHRSGCPHVIILRQLKVARSDTTWRESAARRGAEKHRAAPPRRGARVVAHDTAQSVPFQ